MITDPSIVGVTQSVLERAQSGVIDRGPALRVALTDGALSACSVDDMLNGANVAVIGDGSPDNWEVFQFAGAELVGERTYDLSLRLRGQAGTDATAPQTWPVGSYVVLLGGHKAQVRLASSARGLNRHYRIGPARKPLSDPSFLHQVHAFKGIGLRPYAPVHLVARDAADTHMIRWIRRSRIDGDTWGEGDVPLGESSERYRLRIIDGGSIKREVEVTTPEWSYDATMRSADLVSGPYVVEVAQISDRFGPGPYARLDVAL